MGDSNRERKPLFPELEDPCFQSRTSHPQKTPPHEIMTHAKQFWEDCIPMGGTHVAAGWAGLLFKIRTTVQKFTENCLLSEGPHDRAEKIPP